MYENLYLGSGVVIYLADLYLALLGSFQYGLDERCRGLAIRNLGDGQRLVIYLVDSGTYTYGSTALTIVVAGHINKTACLEVGI